MRRSSNCTLRHALGVAAEVLACPGGEAALLAAGFSKVDGACARALRSAPPGGERHPAARTWTAQMGLSECISGI